MKLNRDRPYPRTLHVQNAYLCVAIPCRRIHLYGPIGAVHLKEPEYQHTEVAHCTQSIAPETFGSVQESSEILEIATEKVQPLSLDIVLSVTSSTTSTPTPTL